MSDNRKAKEELIKRYGAECFIEKLHLRKATKPRRYTSKGQLKKMRQLTYHHIKMKKNGGKATVENGALLSAENHRWFHQQSNQAQRYMNDMFQKYKKEMDEQNKECKVVFSEEDIELPYRINVVEFDVDEKGRYNRAEKKREDRDLINAYYESLENERER